MSLNRVFSRQDILKNVMGFIPSDSPAYGVLAGANRVFHTAYQEWADNAKSEMHDKLFVALRDYIEADLVGKQGFEKTDDDYNDLDDESYYMLLVHSTHSLLVYLLRIEGHSILVSAKNFGWEDFTVSTAAEWDVYSPRMSVPVDDESADEDVD